VTAGKVHEWYQRCLLCIACPRYEPFGLTPFEAAATGCALICSRTGAFDQLVEPGVNGQLVDTSDAVALAAATIEIMKDPKIAEKMGFEANKKVKESFSLEKEAFGISQVYKKLFNSSLN
jgi:mannosyltransferase